MAARAVPMRPVERLVSFDQARMAFHSRARLASRTEHVALDDAAGRVLAETVVCLHDVPSSPRSAMDGYAVRAADVGPGAALALAGIVHAGQDPRDTPVHQGTCVQIATGAVLPPGADAVVMVEATRMDGAATILFADRTAVGNHVLAPGSDMAAGSTVLAQGTVLDPYALASAAAGGRAELTVFTKPRVLVAATGDEVRSLGSDLGPGQVHDSNAVGLAALFAAVGCDVTRIPPVPDSVDALDATLAGATDWDAVVLTGGTSAGERDLLGDAVARQGAVDVHGVRVKPGKPLLVGCIGGTLVVGLPGFPTSCMLMAAVFVAPALARMAGRELPGVPLQAPIASPVASPPSMHHIVPVRIDNGRAVPTFRGSSATMSLSGATGVVHVPEGIAGLSAGQMVDVYPLAAAWTISL